MKVPSFYLIESFFKKGAINKFPIYDSSFEKVIINDASCYIRRMYISRIFIMESEFSGSNYCLEKVTVFLGGKIVEDQIIVSKNHYIFLSNGNYEDIEEFYPLFEYMQKTLPKINIIKR